MAINKIDQPGSTAPTLNTDYTQQNLINVGSYIKGPAILTQWADTGTEPDIENGTYIHYSGNIYQVQGGDENIGGTIQEGLNYVILTTPDAGATLTAAWGNDLTGYVYNEAYQGLYNTGALAIQAICNKAGSVYKRGLFNNTTLTGAIYYSDDEAVLLSDASIGGDTDISGTLSVTGLITGTTTNAQKIPFNSTGTFILASDQLKNLYSDIGAGLFTLTTSGTTSFPDYPGNTGNSNNLTCFIDSTRTTVNLVSGYYRYWRWGE